MCDCCCVGKMKPESSQNKNFSLGTRLTGPEARRVATLMVFVLIFDQASKQFMTEWIFSTPKIHPVMPFLNFVPVWNSGISFGMFANGGAVFRVCLILFAFAMVGWFFAQASSLSHTHQIAAGLISGGAIGNAIDRLRYGKVVDFIDVHVQSWHWPAFNVADAAITVGACLWGYSIFFGQETGKE